MSNDRHISDDGSLDLCLRCVHSVRESAVLSARRWINGGPTLRTQSALLECKAVVVIQWHR